MTTYARNELFFYICFCSKFNNKLTQWITILWLIFWSSNSKVNFIARSTGSIHSVLGNINLWLSLYKKLTWSRGLGSSGVMFGSLRKAWLTGAKRVKFPCLSSGLIPTLSTALRNSSRSRFSAVVTKSFKSRPRRNQKFNEDVLI